MISTHDRYRSAIAADLAWSDELRRLFGKNAGDVRYTKQGAGVPGSKLRRLHDAKIDADNDLFDAENRATAESDALDAQGRGSP